MFLMGDEVRRTQQGNNNAYCQDNEISWFDWSLVDANGGLLRFVSGLLHWRQNSVLYRDRHYWSESGGTDIHWHGVRLGQPDWTENSHSLAFELTNADAQEHLFAVLNAYWEPLAFELPQVPEGRRWARLVDTARPSPEDFLSPAELLPDGMISCEAQPRSAVALIEQPASPGVRAS